MRGPWAIPNDPRISEHPSSSPDEGGLTAGEYAGHETERCRVAPDIRQRGTAVHRDSLASPAVSPTEECVSIANPSWPTSPRPMDRGTSAPVKSIRTNRAVQANEGDKRIRTAVRRFSDFPRKRSEPTSGGAA